MAFTSQYSATATYKKTNGNRGRAGVSRGVSQAASQGLLTAELKLKSGQQVYTVSESITQDPTLSPLGHTDDNDAGIITLFSPSLEKSKNITIENMSVPAYKSAANDGSIDPTKADIVAWLAAYNTNFPTPGDWVIKEAHYSKSA